MKNWELPKSVEIVSQALEWQFGIVELLKWTVSKVKNKKKQKSYNTYFLN